MAANGSSSSAHGFRVGQRVRMVDTPDVRGTLRYVGGLPGRQGFWLGVEWDDPSRGRHDGVLEGKRYFSCQVEGAGSFVREHKVDGGITLVEALRARYQQEGEKDMRIVSSGRVMRVTMLGVEKTQKRQSQLSFLQTATLINMGVSSMGPSGEIRSVAPELRELDLGSNLMSDWSVLTELKAELPSLSYLNLSSCRFPCSPRPTDLVMGLRTLVLNNCSMAWKEIVSVGEMLPDLQELHLCRNSISSLQMKRRDREGETGGEHKGEGGGEEEWERDILIKAFPKLRLLDLEENLFCDWTEIFRVSHLPSLEELWLSANAIERIHPLSYVQDKGLQHDLNRPFQGIRSLRLGSNRLADWASIDVLDSFPLLEDLRISDNPLGEKRGSFSFTQWEMTVARVGTVRVVNHSQVKDGERRRCEISYVHFVMEEMRGIAEEKIATVHPRFAALRKKYNIELETAPRDPRKTAVSAHTFIMVKLKFLETNSQKVREVSKKLPVSTTLWKLKLLCERLFRVNSKQQVLLALDQNSTLPIFLDNESETLGGFSLPPSPLIVVTQGNPEEWRGAPGPLLETWWRDILSSLSL